MRITNRGIVTMLGAVAFVAAISLSAFAQEAAPQAPAARGGAGAPAAAGQEKKADSAKGELKSVDATKMTITLADGQTFQYTSSTKVTGATGGVAGLATASGREVTIDFQMKGADKIATAITVAAEKK